MEMPVDRVDVEGGSFLHFVLIPTYFAAGHLRSWKTGLGFSYHTSLLTTYCGGIRKYNGICL